MTTGKDIINKIEKFYESKIEGFFALQEQQGEIKAIDLKDFSFSEDVRKYIKESISNFNALSRSKPPIGSTELIGNSKINFLTDIRKEKNWNNKPVDYLEQFRQNNFRRTMYYWDFLFYDPYFNTINDPKQIFKFTFFKYSIADKINSWFPRGQFDNINDTTEAQSKLILNYLDNNRQLSTNEDWIELIRCITFVYKLYGNKFLKGKWNYNADRQTIYNGYEIFYKNPINFQDKNLDWLKDSLKKKIVNWIQINSKSSENPQAFASIYQIWLDNPNFLENVFELISGWNFPSIDKFEDTMPELNQETTIIISYEGHNNEIKVQFNDILELLNTGKLTKDARTATLNLDLPLLLGFGQFAEKNSVDAGGVQLRDLLDFTATRNELLSADAINAALRIDPAKFAAIADKLGAKLFDDSLSKAEQILTVNQCALMSPLMLQQDVSSISMNNYWMNNTLNSPLNPLNHGSSRIYPVIVSYDPVLFYNKCLISNEAKKALEPSDKNQINEQKIINRKLFWVFEDKDKNLREIELVTNTDDQRAKNAADYNTYLSVNKTFLTAADNDVAIAKAESISGEAINNAQQAQAKIESTANLIAAQSKDDNYHFLTEAEVKFEGTNPSTARNDVQVQIKFQLSSLSALQSIIATIPKECSGKSGDVEIKLYDLITLPITNEITKGPGDWKRNQFHPEYSRVRLKLYPGKQTKQGNKVTNENLDTGCDLIVDLTMIDHSIDRESSTGMTTLTINYRGFFETMLAMPFNDVLATKKTIDKRKEVHDNISSIMKGNCTSEMIREAISLEQQLLAADLEQNTSQTIIESLSNLSLIHSYEFDDNLIKKNSFGGKFQLTNETFVKTIIAGEKIEIQETDAVKAAIAEKDEKKFLTSLENVTKIKKFFFLGDLLWVVSNCLFKSEDPKNLDSIKMREDNKNLNMRFIISSINVPDPTKNDLSAFITINPCCIPIDLSFFIQWFHDVVVSKGLKMYAVGYFIRDLIERLINNIIFDSCFMNLSPNENAPTIRSQFISNFEDKWFEKDSEGWLNPNNPYQDSNQNSNHLFVKNALAKFNNTQASNNCNLPLTNPSNYFIIYQQYPSFSQNQQKDRTKLLRNEDFVPTIFYGLQNKDYNYVSDVSFSKTTSPFLRESRYYNTNYGNLSLLANVYDLSFSFKRQMANTYLYPGNIINFVLLDWKFDNLVNSQETSGLTPEQAIQADKKSGGATNPFVALEQKKTSLSTTTTTAIDDEYTIFGDNNPHSPNAMAHILGLGGYFVILSVTYSLSPVVDAWDIKISAKYLGSDAILKPNREDAETKKLEDTQDCINSFNTLVAKVTEFGISSEKTFEPITSETTPMEQQSNKTKINQERASEIVVEADQNLTVNNEQSSFPDFKNETEFINFAKSTLIANLKEGETIKSNNQNIPNKTWSLRKENNKFYYTFDGSNQKELN